MVLLLIEKILGKNEGKTEAMYGFENNKENGLHVFIVLNQRNYKNNNT